MGIFTFLVFGLAWLFQVKYVASQYFSASLGLLSLALGLVHEFSQSCVLGYRAVIGLITLLASLPLTHFFPAPTVMVGSAALGAVSLTKLWYGRSAAFFNSEMYTADDFNRHYTYFFWPSLVIALASQLALKNFRKQPEQDAGKLTW